MTGLLRMATRRGRLGWHRLIERGTLRQHPVSLTRQRAGTALSIVLAAGFAWYAAATRDEAIRRRAIDFLTEVTSGEVRVERARFRMFGGTTLYGVRVSVPFGEEFDPTAVDPASREIFTATSLKLVHNTWRLLLGSLRVDHIVATEPKIVLVRNVDTGLRNWQLLTYPRSASPARRRHRPKITLRSATVEVVSIHKGGGREARIEKLDADVRPHPQLTSGFCIEIRRFTEPAERATVVFDPGSRLVTNTPFVDARTIRLQLPRPARQFFDRIGLQGEVKLSRLIYDTQASQRRDTAIELRHVSCAVPFSMLGSSLSSHDRDTAERQASGRERNGTAAVVGEPGSAPAAGSDGLITMTDVQGRLTLRGDRLELDVAGLINGAKCSVTGHLEDVDAPPDRMGIDVAVRGVRVPAPEGRLREQILTDSRVPEGLRQFFEDYDPHGDFDIDFHFVRPPGVSEKAALSGRLHPRGARARCRWFAYPVDDLFGEVRFASGQVHIEGIRGRHGPVRIVATGLIDRRTRRAAVDVTIAASDVPLDADLFEQLSDRYKRIWRRFNPDGRADINVRVQRSGAGPDAPRPPFQTTVTAALVDAQICFDKYPYPLEQARGRVVLGEGRIRFEELTGRHAEASVRIDGHATLDVSEDPEVELRIDAKSMRLDETLAKALPPDGRALFEQFRPQGRVDLAGTISLRDEEQGLIYDMRAKLHDATLCYQHFPYPIEGVSAEVVIRPDEISILNVTGRHGAAAITARGNVRRFAARDGFAADLTLDARQLPLDRDLHDALPAPLKDVWHLLEPTGSVRVQTLLHIVSENGRRRQHHRTEIEAADASLRFRGIPLPLSSVFAHVLVTDRQVEIRSLRGNAGDGTIHVSGLVDTAPPGLRGVLSLDVDDMTFNDELVAAMPGPVRAWLEAIKPAGRFDLHLDPLRFEIDQGPAVNAETVVASRPSDRTMLSSDAVPAGARQGTTSAGRARWGFAGRLGLKDARGRLGFEMREVTGHITGRGSVTRNGDVVLDARAELDRAVLAGLHLEDVLAHIVTDPPTQTLLVEDASGHAYGGEVGGTAVIDLGGRNPSYEMSIAVRDVQLSRYLEVHGRKGPGQPEKNATARGAIYGNLALRGRGGSRPFREGVGEVFVREAHIWKLPIVFSLFQVLNLTPDENVFHDGRLKYSLSRDELTFQHIDLQGKALSFVGGGRMGLRDGQIDLTLLAGSPVRIRVPFLTDILEGASRELMEVRVTGTLRRPQIAPQPLKSLTQALKTLFPEPPRQFHADPVSAARP